MSTWDNNNFGEIFSVHGEKLCLRELVDSAEFPALRISAFKICLRLK